MATRRHTISETAAPTSTSRIGTTSDLSSSAATTSMDVGSSPKMDVLANSCYSWRRARTALWESGVIAPPLSSVRLGRS